MHSVSDLTTFARRTKGDVPPSLVGASTTVVGNKMYLFGGRLVSLRKMVADMYEFDLQTYVWRKIDPKPDEEVPGPRYFHSADAWNNHLVIFGGMGYTESLSDELCVLSDVRIFSLTTLSWLPPTPVQTASAEASADGTQVPPPRARYAHLSAITSSRLFIIGGQNLSNDWLDDIHVYDLPTSTWVMWKPYPRHCGTYRSVAVCAAKRVRSPTEEMKAIAANQTTNGSPPPQGYNFLGPVGARFIPPERGGGMGGLGPTANHADTAPDGPTPTRELVHLPYSCEPTDNYPNDVFLYSNYNFTDVRRELEVLKPLPNHDFEVEDRSNSMSGAALPPGLRFPTGAILGHHLVIAGTYLAHSYQSFSIWALDLMSMTWSRIDPGATLSNGSWSRGVLWEKGNRFLIFGNREGNLVEDYNRRLLSWEHVAYIDLEAFGIYQPPELALSLASQELGLAALEEGSLADFELVCDDGRKIGCSRKILEERWPWFKERRKEFVDSVHKAMVDMPNGGKARGDVAMPELPGVLLENGDREKPVVRPDPRLTPRNFQLSEPYPVTLAFSQWIYAQALLTRLQHAPPVLSALLLLATTYKLELLEKQVRHAMHRALNPATSVGVYEVATLCDCQSLQIRALKVVMSSSRQRSNTRPRHQGGQSGGGGTTGPDDPGARPRGMSDAPNLGGRGNGVPPRGPGGSYAAPPQAGPSSGQAPNGYVRSLQHGQQLKLAITMPSNDGHTNYEDEGPQPDPQFKFGVTTPYTTMGPGAVMFENEDTLASAVDPYGGSRSRVFQPRRKDSTISGGGSDSGSSNTNVARAPPPSQPSRMKREQTLRPTTADSVASNMTSMSDRTLIQQEEINDGGKMGVHSATGAPPGVAEARMRRLLHELDSIGLTDDMTIGRPSLDGEDWAASSSMDHSTAPTITAPLSVGRGGVPPSSMPPTRQEEFERMQQFAQSRNWPPPSVSSAPPLRNPYTNQLQIQQRNYRYPDAPESASPHSESDDGPFFGGGRADAMGPYSAGPGPGPAPPYQQRQGSFSQPGRAPQTAPGNYRPVQAAPFNSAAFPMPPRSVSTIQQGPPPVVMRTPRRSGTAGNDPPVAYYNNVGHTSMHRNRFGSDQNLRDRYLGGAPAASSTSIASGSQSSQMGLSPISPASAPAMTISSSGSRTNSTGSGALETPVEGTTPTAPVSIRGAEVAQSPTPTLLDPSKEKKQIEKTPTPAQEIVITTTAATEDKTREKETEKEKAIGITTTSSTGANSSTSSGPHRGSLDAAMVLKGSLNTNVSREQGAKSPIVDLQFNSALNHNPFLGGGFGGGLSFGGVSFAVKDREGGQTVRDRDPPPYRMHSPPSSGPTGGRSNSLRAGSVGGRSDGSGSSFGEGIHNSRSDHSSTKRTTPAVALATAFVKEGVAGLNSAAPAGPPMTKAEKQAEKLRMNAEKAAKKAEAARRKVEEEKEAKLNAAEIKKKKQEEKIMKRLQAGEGLMGISGMGMIH